MDEIKNTVERIKNTVERIKSQVERITGETIKQGPEVAASVAASLLVTLLSNEATRSFALNVINAIIDHANQPPT